MKTTDLHALEAAELQSQITDWQQDLYALQEAVRLGKEQNSAKIGQLRRMIARGLTVLHEKQTVTT